MPRLLIAAGLLLIILGLAWPYLSRLGLKHLLDLKCDSPPGPKRESHLRSDALARLPGDIVIRREGFSFYFPIVTCLIVSAAASLIIWLMRR